MRKAQKKMALEFIQTLYQAHDQIRSMINRKETSGAMNLLEQCQDGAIQLGGLIEQEEGESFVTVDLLEAYCEIIYQIHENVGTSGNENGDKAFRLLRKQLIQVENSIKNDIKQKIEAVFLPYNASMWDSLESVWKAADEDENCDAYVIPIPYYDKNPDGSFKEEYWEGDRYPDYVPITKYDAYDFAERRPDMIFIHNPYDNCNLVTSVHPFFYSKNLKQFTDKLIYIPYFILDEISPDNQQAVENMQHFCTVPGVLNADNTIVQSEDMRRIYINVLAKSVGENTRGYWENKISGLGSPKVDKVLNTKKEDLQISKEWMSIIQKPDGSWKKVVFYNTSIGALLQHERKMLEKMKDVFKTFKESRNDVALLWRPHPLIKATIESMRPQLWKEYKELVEWYREERWGIYDDSADMNRAVTLSDAYYGDESSVLRLFYNTKKQAMVQDVGIDLKDKKFRISFEDAVFEQENIIFPAWDYDTICSYNLKTGITKKLSGYVPEDIFKQHVYGSVCKYDQSKYLFAPLFGHQILLYNAEYNKFSYIGLDNIKDEDFKLFFSTIKYKKYVYLLPGTYKSIVRFDCESETIEYFNACIDELKRFVVKGKEFFRHGCGLIDDNLFLASRNSNHILKFNLSFNTSTLIKVGTDNYSYTAICSEGKNCWLAASNGNIIRWSSVNHDCEVIKKPEDVILNEDIPYSDLLYYKDKIYVIPYSANDGIEININTGKACALGLNDSNESIRGFFGEIYNNRLYTYSFGKRRLIEVDLLQHRLFKDYVIYEDQEEGISQEEYYVKNCFDDFKNEYKEANQQSLDFFLKCLKKDNIVYSGEKAESIGKRILEDIMVQCSCNRDF